MSSTQPQTSGSCNDKCANTKACELEFPAKELIQQSHMQHAQHDGASPGSSFKRIITSKRHPSDYLIFPFSFNTPLNKPTNKDPLNTLSPWSNKWAEPHRFATNDDVCILQALGLSWQPLLQANGLICPMSKWIQKNSKEARTMEAPYQPPPWTFCLLASLGTWLSR